ncbi:unnamed protein product [Arabis nemorensis]|uniref:FKB95-like N-terminal Kelch domain-containing protein n=1 Tax=Arabis nemorensis TaxID=586526 RepID=A0A565C4H6_9BRAS|nr:unnamed protein product [Arabis nemorensis]
MPFGSAVVTIGHEMYLIGGCDDYRKQILNVFLIDCRNHTLRELPSMNRARCGAAAGVIDGKIYVIGGFEKKRLSGDDWIQVYDFKTEVWSPVPGPYHYGSELGEFETSVVMEEKIYVLDRDSCFSYEPKTRKWESSYDRLRDFWLMSSCVVDDRLYTIDPLGISMLGSSLIVYDPVEKDWVAVKGVHGLPKLLYHDAKMANFGGKLVILGASQMYTGGERDIWCVEIGLERRQGGEIRGNVESVKCVLTSMSSPWIDFCRTVTV